LPGKKAKDNRRLQKYCHRFLDLGRDRFPKDFEECDGERGLIFFTLPLMERRRCVTAPSPERSVGCSEGFFREVVPALVPVPRPRLVLRGRLVFARLLY